MDIIESLIIQFTILKYCIYLIVFLERYKLYYQMCKHYYSWSTYNNSLKQKMKL